MPTNQYTSRVTKGAPLTYAELDENDRANHERYELAEAARLAAEAARLAAETAQTGAETAETNAGNSASAASGSAGTAAGHASDAGDSAMLSAAWAEGVEPGGVGTKSAKGHAAAAAAAAASVPNINDAGTATDEVWSSQKTSDELVAHEAAADPHPGYILETEKGSANGVATLGADSKIPAAQLPAIAITEYLGESADQSAMLALVGQSGDWTIRTDLGTVWVITGDDPSLLAHWQELGYPTAPVTSVAGKTGSVTLETADVSGAVDTTDSRLSDSRDWIADVVSQAEAEAGTATTARKWTAQRVRQATSAAILDPHRRAVEAASGGRMTVLYTAQGQASYMHVLPRFLLEDVDPSLALGSGTHPAFLVDGVAKSELFIGAYLASVSSGEAVSRAGVDPHRAYDFDQARAACVAAGAGWHLMTNWEWAAVALWCMANGYEPLGNTNWGRHHDSRFETGRRVDGGIPGEASGTGATLTGSGPASWSHDGTTAGVADLVGNCWEWNDGFRLEDGRVYMPNDNDYGLAEGAWTAHDLWFSGSTTTASGTVNLITTDSVVRNGTVGDDANSGFSDSRNPWSSTPITGSAPLVTKQALIAPAGISPVGAVYARTYGARFPLRGGNWSNAGSAGLAALNLYYSRGYVHNRIGFRPAFAI